MKRLYLARHAKSSWEHPELNDFERPLNRRGLRAAPRMGKYLAGLDVSPDIIVTSPARRARETADALAHAIGMPVADSREDSRIYTASALMLLKVMRSWDEAWNSVLMIGHNPGIAEVAVMLTGRTVGHVPTCAVMELDMDVTSWRDVKPGCGILGFKAVPKEIM